MILNKESYRPSIWTVIERACAGVECFDQIFRASERGSEVPAVLVEARVGGRSPQASRPPESLDKKRSTDMEAPPDNDYLDGIVGGPAGNETGVEGEGGGGAPLHSFATRADPDFDDDFDDGPARPSGAAPAKSGAAPAKSGAASAKTSATPALRPRPRLRASKKQQELEQRRKELEAKGAATAAAMAAADQEQKGKASPESSAGGAAAGRDAGGDTAVAQESESGSTEEQGSTQPAAAQGEQRATDEATGGSRGDTDADVAESSGTADVEAAAEAAEEYDEASVADAWAQISATRENEGKSGASAARASAFSETTMSQRRVLVSEVLREFKNLDLTRYQGDIKVEDFGKSGMLRRVAFLVFGKPKLRTAALRKERDRVFLLAKAPLDREDSTQARLLTTLYQRVLSDTKAVPLYGSHWTNMGFQGSDPATDLRSAGLLGLVQMLSLAETFPRLTRRILELSKQPDQKFPFAVVSLNWTGVVLQVLREGKLFSLINAEKSVWDVINRLHAATYLQFFLRWKNEHLSIRDFGDVRNDMAKKIRANPRACLRRYKVYQESKEVRATQNSELGDGKAAF